MWRRSRCAEVAVVAVWCGSRHAGDCGSAARGYPGRCHGSSHSEKALLWQARMAAVQLWLAGMAAVGAGMCGSRHAGDCGSAARGYPGRCHGSSHSEKVLLWQARMAAVQLWLAGMAGVGAGMCGSRHAGDCGSAARGYPGRCHGSSHSDNVLLWLAGMAAVQLWLAGMAAVGAGMCGSRHAGDCGSAARGYPGRCHGSSHSEKVLLWLAGMAGVGAGMPATATAQRAATPVAAMAAPTARKCCCGKPGWRVCSCG